MDTAHLLRLRPPAWHSPPPIGQALLTATIAVALAAAGCGVQAPAAHTVTDAAICPHAPHRLAVVLRQEARDGDRLRRLFAVRSNADLSGKAPEVREGVYFVSGNVGAAVYTWAVNAHAWRTGTGLIVAADRQTRAVSPRRWNVSARRLERRFGISPHTDGYARARACANPTR